jgi:exodeoxyribonuclease VII small subunit
MSDAPLTEPSLETHLARLEDLATKLEREDLELDAALRLFEEGVTHLRAARQILRQSELRVERLLADATGEPEHDDRSAGAAGDGE